MTKTSRRFAAARRQIIEKEYADLKNRNSAKLF